MLIAILFLNKEDRQDFEERVEIETEPVYINRCCFNNCVDPFFEHIKSIHVNRTTNFLNTPQAVRMMSVFKISLVVCIKNRQK
jgi:hypothetical protein